MSKHRFVWALALVVSLAGGAEAKTFNNIKGTLSGTATAVPVDITGDSCTVVGDAELCTATSNLSIYAGQSSGGPITGPTLTGPFTGQNIAQTEPVAGAGCSFAPTTIAACTIGTNDAGCEYSYVGGAGASRLNFSGDLEAYVTTGGTLCLDGTTFAFTGTETGNIVGGSGRYAKITGTASQTFNGQILISDPAGNGFSWFTSTFTGTLTK